MLVRAEPDELNRTNRAYERVNRAPARDLQSSFTALAGALPASVPTATAEPSRRKSRRPGVFEPADDMVGVTAGRSASVEVARSAMRAAAALVMKTMVRKLRC